MKRVTQLFLVAALAALLSPAVASSAPRMYVGFHDDVAFRWNANRSEVLGQARAANATIVRTLVDWSKTAPTRPANAANPFDPAYRFSDVDELVRNAHQRGLEVLITIWGTPKWANGGKTPNNVPRNVNDLKNFSRAVAARYSGRYAQYPWVGRYSVWNESNLQLFLAPAVRRQGAVGRTAALREDVRGRLRRAEGRQLPCPGRDRLDLVTWARQEPRRQLRHALAGPLRAAGRGREPAAQVRRVGAAPVSDAAEPEADAEGEVAERDAVLARRASSSRSTRGSSARTSGSGSPSTATRRSRTASRRASHAPSRPPTRRRRSGSRRRTRASTCSSGSSSGTTPRASGRAAC